MDRGEPPEVAETATFLSTVETTIGRSIGSTIGRTIGRTIGSYFKARRITRAALRPGAPMMPPPGWAEEPQR